LSVQFLLEDVLIEDVLIEDLHEALYNLL